MHYTKWLGSMTNIYGLSFFIFHIFCKLDVSVFMNSAFLHELVILYCLLVIVEQRGALFRGTRYPSAICPDNQAAGYIVGQFTARYDQPMIFCTELYSTVKRFGLLHPQLSPELVSSSPVQNSEYCTATPYLKIVREYRGEGEMRESSGDIFEDSCPESAYHMVAADCTYSVVTEGAGKGVVKEDSCANHFGEGGKINKQKQAAVFQKRKDFPELHEGVVLSHCKYLDTNDGVVTAGLKMKV
ncbi:hypothetical protein Cgig2_002339 [Carnegiea gigantea]|uniref:Uncharacterized protein n=1 Tax=Carnegiea gigantea TaxID=171969 RepID=A0A9Q1JZF1_9CARY|nr:hypothetical protein Cgig2_002339 [Carnegiea gigantea]